MSTHQNKVLKREDELSDLSEIPEVQKGLMSPEKRSFLGKVKQGVSGVGSKITHQVGSIKENILPHHHKVEPVEEQPKGLFGLINTGLAGIASGISHTLHSVTGAHEHDKSLEEKSHNISNLASSVTQVGGIDAEVHLAQELESKPEEGPIKKLSTKISKTIDDHKDAKVITSENTITPNREGPSTLDKINNQYEKVAEKITGAVEQIKEKVLPGGDKTESNLSQRGEDSDSTVTLTEDREKLTELIQAPTHQINPVELKEFHDVKTGFHETVDEFKHEQRVEELGGKDELVSSNPFGALAMAREESAPEEETRLFGDITNKTTQEQSTESKTLAQVVKEGLTDVTATLSTTLGQATDKAVSTLKTPIDKENLRQVV